MNFILDKWNTKTIKQYYKYQKQLIGSSNNCAWEKRIVNTKLQCFGRTSTKAREVSKQIHKGNFISFLDQIKIKTHFDSLVCAFLVCKIRDFKTFKKHLLAYIKTIDNWASCDTLKFKKYAPKDLFNLSNQLIKSSKEFIRRIGINIYFDLIKEEKYIYKAFKLIDTLTNETKYYVNMSAAWLLSTIYIKYPKETENYLKKSKTNNFIINKCISKCRDSYRVSDKEKKRLMLFKRK